MFENWTRTTTVEVIFWNFCQLAGIVYYLIIRLVIFSTIFFLSHSALVRACGGSGDWGVGQSEGGTVSG